MGWPLMLGISDDMRQAVAGSTAAQWAADFDGRLTRAAQTPADAVILSLLGNDAFAALADGTVTPEEISAGVSALRRTVETVRKARTIVLLYADPFGGRDIRSAIVCPLLNAAIVSTLPPGVETFDTRSVLRPEHFDGSDIHPNRAGHEAIATGLREMLTANAPRDLRGGGATGSTFQHLRLHNPIVAHIMRAGGAAEDCAVALAVHNDRLVDRLMTLEGIAPRRIKLPDGRVMVWHCPDHLIPETDMSNGKDERLP
jgi:hypothetical protein